MSRIHEALQRAYLERGRMPVASDFQVAEPENIPTSAVLDPEPIVKAEIEIDKIERQAWAPSLASFPTLADRGASVEQFRGLRSQIYQARYETPLKTILVASGLPSEGKSFVAANLSIIMKEVGLRVLLFVADIRSGNLA